jgi:rhomboid protease GluP
MPASFVYTTSHVTDTPVDQLFSEACIIKAEEVIHKLGWDVNSVAGNALVANSENERILVLVYYDKLIIKSVTSDDRAHDWGNNRRNVYDFVRAYTIDNRLLTEEETTERFNALAANYPRIPDSHTIQNKAPWKKEPETKKGFLFRKGFVITPSLIIANILLFLLMMLNGADFLDPTSKDIVLWGGNFAPATFDGQWWKMISAQFVHVGVIHLLTNMLALLFVGMTLEPLFGKSRFLSAYILSGIIASMFSMYFHSQTVTAGASGSIFGLFGIFLALLSVNLTDRDNRKRLLPVLIIYIAYLLVGGLKEEHVDVAAHIGGFIGGLTLGYAFLPSLNKYSDKKLKYLTVAGAVTSVLAVAICYLTFMKH